jgi:hypothetical protein
VITRSGRVDELRRAFAAALEDPATRGPRAMLLLTGFVPYDVAEYDALREL